MKIARAFNGPDLAEFSRELSEADFAPELDVVAGMFGIESENFVLDGQFHKPRAVTDKSYRGRVAYVGQWRTTRRGVRFPRVRFYSQRHGGISEVFDGFPVVVELHRSRLSSTSRPTPARRSSPAPRQPDPRQAERRRAATRTLWRQSLPGDHADAAPLRKYLTHRGLACIVDAGIPNSIRMHRQLEYRHQRDSGEWVSCGHFAAMICAVQDLDGIGINCHRLFLTDDGRKAEIADPDDAGSLLPVKKLMPSAVDGSMKGSGVRLYEATESLALGEGIETSLCVRAATELPTWATVSAEGMKSIELPEMVRTVSIYADNDTSNTGQSAAYALAVRLEAEGRRVKVAMPDAPGTDWADVWLRQVREGSTNERERA